MTVNNTTLIHSLNHFQLPISALPTSFVLDGIGEKGTFPHLFNTLENKNSCAPLPAIKFHSAGTMPQKARK